MKILLLVLFIFFLTNAEVQIETNNGVVEPKRNPFIEGFAEETVLNQAPRQSFSRPPISPPVCGGMNLKRTSRLINGVPIKQLPYTWIIPIIVLFNPDDDVISTRLCTGTLIHQAYVLTAASCFKGVTDKKSSVRIGFNILNISQLYEGEDQNMQEMKVFFGRNLYLHPSFNQLKDNDGIVKYTTNDIALIKLDRPTSLMPVCMPYNIPNSLSFPFDDTILNVYSWGKTSENVDYPDIMFGTRLRVETTYACANKLYSTGYDSKALFCGKNYKTKTCGYLGDIGSGAYVYDESNIVVLSGIMTISKYDETCSSPDSFQRVSAHIDWIRNVIRPSAK